ncbi:hypothetical protein [Aeromicrobium sp. 50.2.37]|jgi:hypothetical protein|uniref:hypothetical protein n=1 Tax=Aeromicrobium sp. 50.2.37 TaxID=2969305 RepID=UPI00214FE909|nr:hypothetical protein [Aeromicrobium sp. 50.2.37]MCR4511733.1 hypothetical protein [Aeromicrobium sp. 50.2.37]
MYRMPPLPPLVCSDVVTVLVGLIHPTDGVAILADRASIEVGTDTAAGYPMPAPPRVKVRTNGRGLVAGVAGLAENGGVSVLRLVEDALAATSDLPTAATDLRRALNTSATNLLAGVEPTGPASEVAVLVLMGGHDRSGPALEVIGLKWDGTTEPRRYAGSRAFTPASVQTRMNQRLQETSAAGSSLEEQLRDIGDLLPGMAPSAIVNDGMDVSPEHDYALASRPGQSHVVAVEPPPVTLRIPRH